MGSENNNAKYNQGDQPALTEPGSILLVDDNPVNLQILYKTLQGAGYRLYLAKDGASALAMAREIKPTLILLDILMPDIDGYKVCEILKQDPHTRGISVIFLSALGDSAAKVKGFAVGGVDYISKPFQTDEVLARVRNHIKIHLLEEQLARRNLELELENVQILNAVSDGIIGLDSDGCISILNPSAAAITGWQASECINKPLSLLCLFNTDEHHSVAEEHTIPYRSYRLRQSCHSDMELIRCKDGELISVSITATPRPEGGAVVVLRDISSWLESEESLRYTREELELQRQHMAHMERLNTSGEMAAGIAHEVNQPLTAIANYSGVVRRLLDAKPIDKLKIAELLDKLSNQSRRASDVIQRLRSYVKKPNAGQNAIDINVLLQDVIALAEVDARINDVGVHFQAEHNIPPVIVDAVQIQQVALNLIRNAMESMTDQHSRQQGVLVSARYDDNVVFVEVMDSGNGVEEKNRSELFSPFFTTKVGGMGVGLSICQSIIHAHGGNIAYRNNASESGSTFYFSLPSTRLQ